MTEHNTERLLESMESGSSADPADAMAGVASLAIAINREIDGAQPQLATEGFFGDIGEKIKKWIRRLVAIVKEIATKWGALSYSIGVSLTGVSVSVEWAGPKA